MATGGGIWTGHQGVGRGKRHTQTLWLGQIASGVRGVAPSKRICDRVARPRMRPGEQKYQWGWDGFTIQAVERCLSSRRVVAWAWVYSWWSWYCRVATPGARMEAIMVAGQLPTTGRCWTMSSRESRDCACRRGNCRIQDEQILRLNFDCQLLFVFHQGCLRPKLALHLAQAAL